MLYTVVLSIHNIMRWVVILLAIWALVSAFTGLFQNRSWRESDRKSGSFFTLAITLQLLLGLLLYFGISPFMQAIFADASGAMSSSTLRFFFVEHFIMMIVAVALAHVGTARIKRLDDDRAKFRSAAIWYTLTILVILAGIPWDRPLFRPL